MGGGNLDKKKFGPKKKKKNWTKKKKFRPQKKIGQKRNLDKKKFGPKKKIWTQKNFFWGGGGRCGVRGGRGVQGGVRGGTGEYRVGGTGQRGMGPSRWKVLQCIVG